MSDQTRVEKYDAEQGGIGEVHLENGHPSIRRSPSCETSCETCMFSDNPGGVGSSWAYCDSRDTVDEDGNPNCRYRTYLGNLNGDAEDFTCDDWRKNV